MSESEAMAGQAADLIGRVINRHEITRILGEGGMGAVYLARHQMVGTLRALKVIHDDCRENPGIVKRFKREAVVLGKLRHPSIVEVIEFGHIDTGAPYLLLEYIDGGDLYQLLNERGAMPLPIALQVLLQLGRVLEYAHAQGVVHRDLKPGNVLLHRGDPSQVKVIDFGLVKLVSAEMLTRLTLERQIMGSPHYMAPEQALALPEITGAADVYALATIAYAIASGRTLFEEQSPLALVRAQARQRPERLSTRIQVPDQLDELLYRCLAKEPSLRPTAAELVVELVAILASVSAQPVGLAATALSPMAAASIPQTASYVPAPAGSPTPLGMPAPAGTPVSSGFADDGSFDVVDHRTGSSAQESQQVRLSKSIAREQEIASAADLIFAQIPAGQSRRVREALQRQMMAVVGELASAMAAVQPHIASQRDSVGEIAQQLTDLEMDVAMADAELADADDHTRVDIEARRAALAARTLALARRLDSEQRELAVVVDRFRAVAPANAAALFGELDTMIARAQSLGGTAG